MPASHEVTASAHTLGLLSTEKLHEQGRAEATVEWEQSLHAAVGTAASHKVEQKRRRSHFWHFARNRKLVRMVRSHGMANARHIVRESARTGLHLADACALMSKESTGRNVFGCDYGPQGGHCPYCGEGVSRDLVHGLESGCWPRGVYNGVGPGQLTSPGYVRAADAIGGSWIPKKNMRVSFRTLLDLQHRLGTQNGANAYNGDPTGGYGRSFMGFRGEWQSRINAALR